MALRLQFGYKTCWMLGTMTERPGCDRMGRLVMTITLYGSSYACQNLAAKGGLDLQEIVKGYINSPSFAIIQGSSTLSNSFQGVTGGVEPIRTPDYWIDREGLNTPMGRHHAALAAYSLTLLYRAVQGYNTLGYFQGGTGGVEPIRTPDYRIDREDQTRPWILDVYLKKAYLGRLVIGSRDEPGTNFASFPGRSFNLETAEGFMPTLAVAFMSKNAAKPAWPPRNGLPRIEMIPQPEGSGSNVAFYAFNNRSTLINGSTISWQGRDDGSRLQTNGLMLRTWGGWRMNCDEGSPQVLLPMNDPDPTWVKRTDSHAVTKVSSD
ncbi:hypothetical protein EV702DRAFT_1051940 [Suillus placidus]|uniref:Uncharacterized protein n=1 Tax=Suillus placidus TaxID=48579 RepID=A0A9P7CVM1_9AGAM|nr:hypothetical protein EV702DRAFT_1051940 [Suillus placidus]